MEFKPVRHDVEEIPVISTSARFWRHARKPRNLGVGSSASASATAVGSCGDQLRVDLEIENNVIVGVRYQPQGCLYTLACASAMSELAENCTIEKALQIQPEDVARELEELPDDHLHCARLAVNTLGEAIADYYRVQLAEAKEGPLPAAGRTKEDHANI